MASNPQFLREGTPVLDFLHPGRIVVGAATECASELLKKLCAPLTSGDYYNSAKAVPGPRCAQNLPRLLLTSAKAAEIIKHASNAFLATKISFINVVANICEAAGADVIPGGLLVIRPEEIRDVRLRGRLSDSIDPRTFGFSCAVYKYLASKANRIMLLHTLIGDKVDIPSVVFRESSSNSRQLQVTLIAVYKLIEATGLLLIFRGMWSAHKAALTSVYARESSPMVGGYSPMNRSSTECRAVLAL